MSNRSKLTRDDNLDPLYGEIDEAEADDETSTEEDLYAFDSGSESEGPSLPCNLPREVWSLILSCVPQEDRIRHRLVSKSWRDLVDQLSSFKIVYQAILPELLDHVLRLRIRACEFTGIKDGVRPFHQPLLVKEITLGARMTAESTAEILSTCTNIEHLRYFATEQSDTAFLSESVDHSSYLSNLKNLKSIEIGLLFFGRQRSEFGISSCVQTLLGNRGFLYHGIQEILIHCDLSRAEWNTLFEFVGRHSRTLCKVGIYRQCPCDYEESPNSDESTLLHQLKVFNECHLKSFVILKGASYKCRCAGELLWYNMLKQQYHMVSLHTDLVPSVEVIDEFVVRNKESLRDLNLQDIALGLAAHMDCSVLEGCNNLENLTLHFLQCSVIVMKPLHGNNKKGFSRSNKKHNGNGSDSSKHRSRSVNDRNSLFTELYPECGGLQALPKSLKTLSISGCDILSSTLIEMSQNLSRLRHLYLGEPGGPLSNRTEFGVSKQVLLSFIQNMPELVKLTIHRGSFNFHVDNAFMENVKDAQFLIPGAEPGGMYLEFNLAQGRKADFINNLQSTCP